ncbi:MAG: HpcH/HpaI aldolase/citrate lyase family protein, partial [Planctomycetota bacterium]
MSSPSLRSRPMPSRAPRRAATDLRAPFFCRLDRDPSAHTARAGTAVLDLEDSVAPGRKVAQRRAIAAALARPLPEDVRVLVRCHGVRESEELTRDLDASGVEALTGFVLPMVTDPDEVRAFDAQLQRLEERRGLAAGRFEVHLLIEQPAALLALEELARSSTRVASLMFGREDFMACLPLASGAAAAQAERRLPLVAAALGLPAVASPYCDVCDLPAFERYARRARDLGYQGVLTVHPAQRAVAERVFTPSAREQRAARKVLASDPGVPVRLNDGRLVGPPMRRRARGLL